MGSHKKVDKPCARCGEIMHNVYEGRKYCEFCRHGYVELAPTQQLHHPPYVGPTLREIMIEANKEGLQYAEYCKKHGLH